MPVMLVSLVAITAVPASAAASISISPTSGPVCTSVTITASGFPPGTILVVQFDGEAVTTTLAVVKTDTNGDVTCAMLVPDAAAGQHTITISDGVNTVVSIFTVTGRMPIEEQLSSIWVVVVLKSCQNFR